MLGTPDHEQLTVEDCIGDVGRMTMRSGSKVWIVGTEFDTTPEFERYMAEVRQTVRRDAPADVQVRGWAWGSTPEGVPTLLDLSRLAAE